MFSLYELSHEEKGELTSEPVTPGTGSAEIGGSTITLSGGLAVSVEALRTAWRLEDAGVRLELDEAGRLRPLLPSAVPAGDRRLVSRWWRELEAIARYCAGVPADGAVGPGPGEAA